MALIRLCDRCDDSVEGMSENYKLVVEMENRPTGVAAIPKKEMDLCGRCAGRVKQVLSKEAKCASPSTPG